MRSVPPRPGPPPALVVAVAAVAGGWAAVRLWPVPDPLPRGAAARAAAALAAPGARARVVRTVDGDTAELAFSDARGAARVTVRYLGVDTPESVDPDEPVQCFGPEASHRNRAWATGRRVRLVFDRERVDPYGRLLAALVVEGQRRSLSERLVAGGYARVLTIAPNGATAPALRRLQERAREDRRGLWSVCGDALPSGA
ncbi:thermonuclease family protein [Patulibacter minatonensis]|uniref:thermonuclease family protein n=1 Tax=Patulibacter minatonensis TaxID=298163 RepID=UPI00068739BF|nr:thermonuclease family protein [Patulibacter minatonensis]